MRYLLLALLVPYCVFAQSEYLKEYSLTIDNRTNPAGTYKGSTFLL
jgi:hypothetical protein